MKKLFFLFVLSSFLFLNISLLSMQLMQQEEKVNTLALQEPYSLVQKLLTINPESLILINQGGNHAKSLITPHDFQVQCKEIYKAALDTEEKILKYRANTIVVERCILKLQNLKGIQQQHLISCIEHYREKKQQLDCLGQVISQQEDGSMQVAIANLSQTFSCIGVAVDEQLFLESQPLPPNTFYQKRHQEGILHDKSESEQTQCGREGVTSWYYSPKVVIPFTAVVAFGGGYLSANARHMEALMKFFYAKN